jgi:hypothetical protein
MRYVSTGLTRLAHPATIAAHIDTIAAQIADDADHTEHAVLVVCGDGTEQAKQLRRAYGALSIALEQQAARIRALPHHWDQIDAADGDRLGAAIDAWVKAREACERLVLTSLKASA